MDVEVAAISYKHILHHQTQGNPLAEVALVYFLAYTSLYRK
jgi:hypothetical protein